MDRDWRESERKSKRQKKKKQEVFGQGWITRGEGGRGKVPQEGSITLLCLIGIHLPRCLSTWWNDVCMTLVRAGGNVKHTLTQHTQTGPGSGGLQQEIPLQPFCWLRPPSENGVRKNVMYMVSVLFGVWLGQHLRKPLLYGHEGTGFRIESCNIIKTNKQVNKAKSFFCRTVITAKKTHPLVLTLIHLGCSYLIFFE